MKFLNAVLAPKRQTCFLDVGANPISPAPYDQLLENGFAQVVAFEPQPLAFAKLQQNPIENRTVFPFAIGDGKPAKLHVCRTGGFTSVLEPSSDFNHFIGGWHAAMSVVQTVDLETKRLDDLEELPPIDMLKIDIQGGELAVLENAQRILSDTLCVFTEVAAVQLYKKQPLLDDQMRFLRKTGFELHKFDFFKSIKLNSRFSERLKPQNHHSQLIDGDAIFIKNLLYLERLQTEQLKHLSIIANAVAKSYDLAVAALSILHERNEICEKCVDTYVGSVANFSAG